MGTSLLLLPDLRDGIILPGLVDVGQPLHQRGEYLAQELIDDGLVGTKRCYGHTKILQHLLDELIVALRVAMREVVTKLDHVVLQGALHTQVGILIVHQCAESVDGLSHHIFLIQTSSSIWICCWWWTTT